MTLGACDKSAAKLLYVMEMLNWGLVSWILSSSGREGWEPGQSWDPASAALLTITLHRRAAAISPSRSRALLGSFSAQWGEETSQEQLIRRTYIWEKKNPKHLLSESRSRVLVFLRPLKGSALTAGPRENFYKLI